MEAVPEARLAEHPAATLYAVKGVDARVRQELSGQFEAAVAFADYCTFLTAGRLGGEASQLVSLAQELFAETSADLQRSRPRG